MEFRHITVLKNETIDSINVKKGGIYIDMTLGGGGHSEEILKRGGRVLGIDRDDNAITAATKRLGSKYEGFTAVRSNFSEIREIVAQQGIDGIDGAVMDLGVSSHQLDTAERGFSYMQNAPLDMRMDMRESKTAKDIVNGYSEKRLCEIIEKYGEERWAKRIAQFIVQKREESPIETTFELVDIIKAAVPKAARQDGPHPAKRTFQAIRIELNGELEILESAIKGCVDILKPGGRIGVITFHSLEDRIVKNTFKELADGCTCPRDFPICTCGNVPKIKIVTKKPYLPSEEELLENPRARSAKLRTAEKIRR